MHAEWLILRCRIGILEIGSDSIKILRPRKDIFYFSLEVSPFVSGEVNRSFCWRNDPERHFFQIGRPNYEPRFACTKVMSADSHRTYSNANGCLFMPVLGGVIQPAILPGSVTGTIKLRTHWRSSLDGSHSCE